MSFFFTSPRKITAPKRPAPVIQGRPSNARMAASTLNRLGCAACPLDKCDAKTPKMKPELADKTLVYFLGEFPSEEDDENGLAFSGSGGKLILDCIPEGDEQYCSFDHVARDATPKNRNPTWQEIECCRGNIIRSIESVKPKLILGLGIIPLSWALGTTDITGLRGRIFSIKVGNHNCYFLPTYSPEFIINKAYNKRKPMQGKLGNCLAMDIKRAFKAAGKLSPPTIDNEAQARAGVQTFDGVSPSQFEALMRLLKAARAASIKAIDIETYPLRPYSQGARILTVALSFDNTNFAFALDHPKSGWGAVHKRRILIELREIVSDNTLKVAHNAPFEIEWFISLFDRDIINHNAWHCTQMQSHLLDERTSHQGLDFLVKQYFGIAYKGLFKLDKKNMDKANLDETLIYNGVDTKYTLRLHHHQFKLLKEAGLYKAYMLAIPRQTAVATMQSLGMDVDQVEVKRLQNNLGGEIAGLTAEIDALDVVKKYKADRRVFNPLGDDAVIIFRDYLKRKEITKDDGSISIDKGVLDKIDHPLADLIIKLRNKTKLKSTYVDNLELGVGVDVYPDGKIHTSFNTTFTETGRTSSSGPNIQNVPARTDSWVRKQVVAPKGHYLLAFDYGQLEACTAAMCSKDKTLVKALWDDYDIHMEWTEKLHKAYPKIGNISDKGERKTLRSRIKNKLVFPAIFGAQNSSIAGYLGVPEDIVAGLMTEFWQSFSGLKRWQDQTMKMYYDKGYVEAPTGRRHHYPLTRNQAINHPIQCLASEIVCTAMTALSKKAADDDKWYLHPHLNIHDDLTFVVPDNDAVIDDAMLNIYTTMLTPPWKDLINVPMSVSASLGRSWYGMKEIGKFWSHKDL